MMLARALEESDAVHLPADDIVVIGLARGGVEVAAEVAVALHAPLDALAVRKVGHPWEPEYGLGAVAPGGVHYVRASDGLSDAEILWAVHRAEEKAVELDAVLHAHIARIPVTGATCVLVDDGLATGGTMVAAARWARVERAHRVLVAVPVGAAATLRTLETDPDVDAALSLLSPSAFGAVGAWYTEFGQLSDEDVIALLTDARDRETTARAAEIATGGAVLDADLSIPARPLGWVVFAHGSGSSRASPRNRSVATALNRAGLATLLFDLLTEDEARDRANVFDVQLLADRLIAATRWLEAVPQSRELPIAYFGASTGAAAALVAAAELGERVAAVVSRGGRPDLARGWLDDVQAPTLLVVGGADPVVLDLNSDAAARLTCPHRLAVVRGASHLFEEPGALEEVAELAAAWFTEHLDPTGQGNREEARHVHCS
jgi:putative phosphoribosyl transferase